MRYHHGVPHSIASGQVHFTAKEAWQWAHTHGGHWPYPGPHHPKEAGLIEWPFYDSVTGPARWQYLVGPGPASPGRYIGSESASNT